MTGPSLKRTTFRTSRLAEFCSEKELVNQTGHDVEDWPLVVLKELMDNALDACEEVGTAPVIDIAVTDCSIVIADNGPGIPSETIEGMLDYTARVSSREAYVSPTRGAQGNALKTILAMAFALDGESGETVIEAHRIAHCVTFSIDQMRREPKISYMRKASPVKTGIRISMRWLDSACSYIDESRARFLQIADDFGRINAHLTLSVDWNGKPCVDFEASNPAWTKWRPSDPTSPHWYDTARLERLIGAYVAYEQERGHSEGIRVRIPRVIRHRQAEDCARRGRCVPDITCEILR